MCLLIWKPAGVELPEESIRNGFTRNNDGGGLCWVQPGIKPEKALAWDKGFFGKAGEDAMVTLIKGLKDAAAMVHFRIKTHGPTNKENCHPHYLEGDKEMIWMMGHNGILQCVDICGNESDTAAFARVLRDKLVRSAPRAILSPEWQKATAKVIGSGNKLVFLNNFGQHVIINESAGYWDEGVWYSNSSYKTWKQQTTPNIGYKSYDPDHYGNEWYNYKDQTWVPSKKPFAPAERGADGQFLPKKDKKKIYEGKHQPKDLFPTKEPDTEKWQLSKAEQRELEAELEAEGLGKAFPDEVINAIEDSYENSDFEYIEVDLKRGCSFCSGGAGRKFVVFRDGSICCKKCERDYRNRREVLAKTGAVT